MSASPILLTPQSAALDSLEGMANSYVRGRKKQATLRAVQGQVDRARRSGAPEDEIRSRIQKGITDPPNADAHRARELTQLFLG